MLLIVGAICYALDLYLRERAPVLALTYGDCKRYSGWVAALVAFVLVYYLVGVVGRTAFGRRFGFGNETGFFQNKLRGLAIFVIWWVVIIGIVYLGTPVFHYVCGLRPTPATLADP